MDVRKLLVILVGLGLLIPQLRASASVRYNVVDLGTLGGSNSWAYAINDRGQIVGGSSSASGDSCAFVYDGTMHNLGTLGGSYSEAYGINSIGQIVGAASTTAGTVHAFFYDSKMQDLGTPSGTDQSEAHDINDSGQIVGGAWTSGLLSRAFLYDGTIHDLGTLGGDEAFAYGINNSGQIVGWACGYSNHDRAFLYDGTMQGIAEEGSGDIWGMSYAYCINNLGQVAGYYASSLHAFMYDGTMHDIGQLPGAWTTAALAINDHGWIVGRAVRGSDNHDNHAFVYDGTTMADLNGLIDHASGWTLTEAYGINDSGQIVGNGVNALGQSHAFLLTPVPEPSSVLCLGTALLSFAAVTRTKRRRTLILGAISVTSILILLTGAVIADEDVHIMNSEPGVAALSITSASITTTPPADYTYLPAFPRFFWSYGCVPISGAMIVGYYDNAGFPNMVRYPNGDDLVCQTGNYSRSGPTSRRRAGFLGSNY